MIKETLSKILLTLVTLTSLASISSISGFAFFNSWDQQQINNRFETNSDYYYQNGICYASWGHNCPETTQTPNCSYYDTNNGTWRSGYCDQSSDGFDSRYYIEDRSFANRYDSCNNDTRYSSALYGWDYNYNTYCRNTNTRGVGGTYQNTNYKYDCQYYDEWTQSWQYSCQTAKNNNSQNTSNHWQPSNSQTYSSYFNWF